MTRTIIGRREWTERLDADVDRTVSSHGGLVLLSGEAGIGKTTLVGGVITRARGQGAIAVVGTCSDSAAAPALWPWTQIVRGLQRALGADVFAEYATEAGLDPAELLRVATTARAGALDPQFTLYDAMAALFAAVSHRSPLVLVLEDLHWADAGSLELLQFVARHCWFERLLLVGTYRDTEVADPEHPAHTTLEELVGQAALIQVSGLDPEDVGVLVRQVSGRSADPAFLADLHRRTGGNPFFVEQVIRLGAGGDAPEMVPAGVTEAVRRRLAPLGADATALLRAAATLGGPMPYRLLADVAGLAGARGSAALASALSARLLRATPEGGYGFVHDLVRETVLADLPPADEARLHAAVVGALPEHPDTVLPGQAADHATRAGVLVPDEETLQLVLAAARDADSRMSAPESIAYYRRAVELSADPNRRLLLELELAHEMYFDAALTRRPTTAAAALVARVLTDAESAPPAIAAQVALAARGYTEIDGDLIERVLRRSAADLLGVDTVPESRAAVAAALAVALAEGARDDADDETLANVLGTHHEVLWGPGTAPERQRLLHELVATAVRHGDRETEQFATSMLWVAKLEMGDPGYVGQLRSFQELAARYGTPRFLVGAQADDAVVAGFQGRFAEAFSLYEEIAAGTPEEDLYAWMAHYLAWWLHLRRGDLEESRALLARFTTSTLDHPVMAAAQAAEEGRHEDARALLDGDASGGGPDGPDSLRHESGLRMPMPGLRQRVAAAVAAGTGDPALVEAAREHMRPLTGTWSVDLYGMEIGGPFDYYLGAVEAAAGDLPRATELLDRAIRQADAMATPYWATRGRLMLLDVLGRDHERAAALLRDVESALTGLDAPLLRRWADRPGDAAQPAPVLDLRGEFRREGGVWVLGLGERTAPVPDAKGLADLHTLLTSPGVDVPSVRLLNPDGDPALDAAARQGGDPVLDETARGQYRARLTALDEELDDAGLAGDTRRRDALTGERDALIAELRAATGLAGRPRRLGDQAERARKAVTGRIRDTLRKLEDTHPELAEHLRASVSTGSSCRYDPVEPVFWTLR